MRRGGWFGERWFAFACAFASAPALMLAMTALAAVGCKKPPATDGNLDPMPYSQGLSEQDLATRFSWLEFHPLADPKLFFRIRVPRGWQARPSEITQEELHRREQFEHVTLAEVGPPDQDNLFIRVSYLRSPPVSVPGAAQQDLDPALQAYVQGVLSDQMGTYDPQSARSNWSVLLRRDGGELHGRKVLEELIEIGNKTLGPSVARLQASRQGERVFVVMGVAPSPRYQRVQQDFGVAVESFTLVDAAKQQ